MLCRTASVAIAGAALWGHACSASPDVYQAVTSKVSSLAAQLSEMELANTQALTKLKHNFEETIQDGNKRNDGIVAENIKIREEIVALDKANKELRSKAELMRKTVKLWEQDFKDVHSNFTTSLDFTANTMKKLLEGQASADLKILEEIQQLEAAEVARQSHARRTELVRKASLGSRYKNFALLQVPGANDVTSNPSGFIDALSGGLDDMKTGHEQDKERLKAQYQPQVEAVQDRYLRLQEEQKGLIAQREQSNKLQKKLREAVSFLDTSLQALESNARSIRMFSSRIGIRPVPESHRLDYSASTI